MTPKPDAQNPTRSRPVLLRRTVRADGSTECALRVFCDRQQRSVPVDDCRRCRACVEVVCDADGTPLAVRCPPDSSESAGSALCRGVIVVEPDVPLAHVVKWLADGRTRAVAVSDVQGKIAGVIHESQLLSELLAHGRPGRDESERRIATARLSLERADQTMTSAAAFDAVTPLRRAVDAMARNHGRFVVVVDAAGIPLGVLWDVDGLHALFGKHDEH